MKKFFNRVLIRIYWFYNKVIKESDSFMLFFYTIFAFTMFIVFYVWGLILFIERKTILDFPDGIAKLLVPGGLILLVSLIFFFKRRERNEALMREESNKKFDKVDIGVIAYIVMAFFTFFYNVVQSRI